MKVKAAKFSPNERLPLPLQVRVVGDCDHSDFREAIGALRADAELVNAAQPAELVVVAQSRPDMISGREVEALRRETPLAGVVALLGTWCEGETRTGRPWLGVERLYWYQFPTWWRRQLEERTDGRCPEWARPADTGAISSVRLRSHLGVSPALHHSGVIAICADHAEAANALADPLRHAGYSTLCQLRRRVASPVRGIAAGVWIGGQLEENEADELRIFCRRLRADAAPAIAILDFPRRDSFDLALSMGASAVLGKPWVNADLVTTVREMVTKSTIKRAA